MVVYVKTKTRTQKNVVLENYTPKDIKNVTNQILRSYIIMNTSQKIFTKLFKDEKTELNTHEIKLGLIQELNAEFREFNSKASDAGGFILKAKQILSKNISSLEKNNKKIKEAVKITKDLGITDKPLNSLQEKSEIFLKEYKEQLKKIENL